ncbi:MAG: hypothetical protein ACK5LX_15675 [Oscillospiraceae bacterium]
MKELTSRMLALALCAALLIATFAACSNKDKEESSEEESTVSESQPSSEEESSEEELDMTPVSPASSPAAELSGEKHYLFIYEPDSKLYKTFEFTPSADADLWELVEAVGESLHIEPQAHSITQEKGFVKIDWAAWFVEVNLAQEWLEETFLARVAMTILQNQGAAESIGYTMDGEAYQSEHLSIPLGGFYDAPKLDLAGGNEAAFELIREKVPYEGLKKMWWNESESAPFPGLDWGTGDSINIMGYLLRIGKPSGDISSPSQLDNQYIVYTALMNTTMYSTTSTDGNLYREELLPIAAEVEDSQMILKEHLEETVKLLFGDISFTHETIDNWIWHEAAGVYTPPHMGGPGDWVPVVRSSEATESGYTLEISYLYYGMSGYLDENFQELPEVPSGNLLRFLPANAARYQVALAKEGDSYRLISFRQLEAVPESSEEASQGDGSDPAGDQGDGGDSDDN